MFIGTHFIFMLFETNFVFMLCYLPPIHTTENENLVPIQQNSNY